MALQIAAGALGTPHSASSPRFPSMDPSAGISCSSPLFSVIIQGMDVNLPIWLMGRLSYREGRSLAVVPSRAVRECGRAGGGGELQMLTQEQIVSHGDGCNHRRPL